MSGSSVQAFLRSEALPHFWCAGCGNGIVLGAVVRAFVRLELDPTRIVVVTGIGCWGKADDYLLTHAFHVTHGRALAFATGIKVVRPDLTVLALMGDGDGATIGGNHLIHAARRNVDVTAVVVNNYNYGMTGGQYSATTPADGRTATSRYGNPEEALDICALVAAAGANYVARSTVYHVRQLENFICEAITKKGFALVEAASICPTHYGRNNRLATPTAMLRRLREQAVPVARGEEGRDRIVIGRLVEREREDFNARYEAVRRRAVEGGRR